MSEVPELRGAAEQNLSGRGGSEVYRAGSVWADRRENMEVTSTVRTQTSDTVDIIRETPDRSASYTAASRLDRMGEE